MTLVVSSVLGDQLVAYVVPRPGQVADQSALRAAISESLPPYMVPAAIVVLDAFPLNASGKLDRKALRPNRCSPARSSVRRRRRSRRSSRACSPMCSV